MQNAFWNNRKQRKGILGLIAGLLGAGIGAVAQHQTNKANQRAVRDQMAFQERMSSTAAQRSVQDYTKAGLNPALAYERTASSPSGAIAEMGNVGEAGLSSAKASATFVQDMKQRKLDQELTTHQIAATDAANMRDTTAGHLSAAQQKLLTLQTGWQAAAQPHDLRAIAANALMAEHMAKLREYEIPGARNTAMWESTLGKAGPAIGTARTLSEILKSIGGIRRF